MFINQSFIHYKVPQGDLIFKVVPCWIPLWIQASFGKWIIISPCFEFWAWIFTTLISFKCREECTLTLALDMVNTGMYSCASQIFHLLWMPIQMGGRSWLLDDPLAQAESPWLQHTLETPKRPPIRCTPNKKVGLHLEILQCSGASQPGLWDQQLYEGGIYKMLLPGTPESLSDLVRVEWVF